MEFIIQAEWKEKREGTLRHPPSSSIMLWGKKKNQWLLNDQALTLILTQQQSTPVPACAVGVKPYPPVLGRKKEILPTQDLEKIKPRNQETWFSAGFLSQIPWAPYPS